MSRMRSFADVNFEVLDTSDLINLALQRSSSLKGILPKRRGNHDWRKAYAEALEQNRERVLELIWNEVCSTYESTRAAFVANRPWAIADIGCGQGLIDLLIYDDCRCDLTLIDIEETDDIFFGFEKATGAGYASLAKAREFLVANGVPDRQILTINPKHDDVLALGAVDIATSFISCGFHYPLATYETYFQTNTRKAMIVDIRNRTMSDDEIARFGQPFVIGHDPEGKWRRYLIQK